MAEEVSTQAGAEDTQDTPDVTEDTTTDVVVETPDETVGDDKNSQDANEDNGEGKSPYEESELKRARSEAARYRTERNDVRQSMSDTVTELNAEITDLKEKLSQQIAKSTRASIAHELGVPESLITLGDEEKMREQATSIREYADSQNVDSSTNKPFVQSVGGKESADVLGTEAFARSIFGL